MSGFDSRMRWLALAGALLLLWCHGLSRTALATEAGPAPHTVSAAGLDMAAPAPVSDVLSGLNCCFNGATAAPQAIVPSQPPAPLLPVAVALPSTLLGLAALRIRTWPASPQVAFRPSGLHQRAVLFRI